MKKELEIIYNSLQRNNYLTYILHILFAPDRNTLVLFKFHQ